ncbi:hypothetical protein [Sarcina sp. DSM 11001]|uniref:hypothetical protein n=1 Tax=Sarcina sp. DSM 11001 TaxID=1798184 RepID=UPI001113AB41|nr:hypothetical protein [Sarcina sp. DSM 11001]
MRAYYRIKQLEQPAWIEAARRHYSLLYYTKQELGEMCSNTNIPKSEMEWLASIKDKPYRERTDLPEDLKKETKDIYKCLSELYDVLMDGKDEYFINEWTLTKKGRRKMREYIDKMPSVGKIMPPKTEFTNVPDRISYSNRIYSFDAEYELTVTLGGSRICIRNGDSDYRHTEYIDFTERFLDEVIPMVQCERLYGCLKAKDRSKDRDDSVYQDFKTVLVDINWNEYDLKLLAESDSNPFMELLRLVWEEYGETLRERNLVLPWFKVLEWA